MKCKRCGKESPIAGFRHSGLCSDCEPPPYREWCSQCNTWHYGGDKCYEEQIDDLESECHAWRQRWELLKVWVLMNDDIPGDTTEKIVSQMKYIEKICPTEGNHEGLS